MPIPGMDSHHGAPPPLPPPRRPLSDDTPFHDNMYRDRRSREQGPTSYDSGYVGSNTSSYGEDRSRTRKGSDDEGYQSWQSNERSLDSFPSRFGLHHSSFQFKSPAEQHGASMKQKLNPLRTSDKPPVSLLSVSSDELLSRRPAAEPRYPPELSMPVKLPYHPRVLDSPAQFDTPIHSAVSPRSTPFSRFPGDYRSPQDSDIDRSPKGRTRRNNSDDASSTQGSYDYMGADDMDMDDVAPLKRLYVDDIHAGRPKRRAASPPLADGSMAPQGDLRLREAGTRGSPTPRLTTQGSMPTLSRSNSYVSTTSMGPSSATTTTSYEHRSPDAAYSSGGVSPTDGNSPYVTPRSLNPSPRGSISARTPLHSRTVSSTTSRRLPEIQKPTGSKLQPALMCECCPKKPRKFDTEEELRAHAAEKQYNCAYCGNRFKNKNEAERHQNSLHVRRHSWSCSALSGFDRAFHESPTRPDSWDACGYCGLEFPRSGKGPIGQSVATDEDWDKRIRHLQDTHKFRECNSSKKFFRADHFRQHLKHSHAGTSGKWTNMLENACMIEEEPPAPPPPR